MNRKNNKRAFTLVELVIVIAVLIILAAIAIPTVSGVIDKANEASDTANAKTIETAIKYATTYNATVDDTDKKETVGDALKLSGLDDDDILTPKRSDYKFYYNNENGNVTCEKEKATSGTIIELSSNDTISDDGTLAEGTD
jgi:type IV pilus assembly protein PilA